MSKLSLDEHSQNCYSKKLNQNSFFGGNKQPYSGQPPELVLDTEAIRKWGFQRKPKKHFVSSMTDVFGEWVPRFWQHEMLDGMFVAPNQIFQILTKRIRSINRGSRKNNKVERCT